jgi:hypothetical protein
VSRERPKWARRLKLWLTDTQYDGVVAAGVTSGWRWEWRDRLEEAGLWMLCRMFGHKPVADQCDKPEHDFCVHCRTPMPGLAPREPRP